MLQILKKRDEKEILLRQPSFVLELCRYWDEAGRPRHRFVLHPAAAGHPCGEGGAGDVLLAGEGHEVSRKDIHYAFYLFQRFHLSEAPARQQANA